MHPLTTHNTHTQTLTFGSVGFVNKTGQDMAVLQVEVVIGSKHIGGDYRSEHTAMLGMVRPEMQKNKTCPGFMLTNNFWYFTS